MIDNVILKLSFTSQDITLSMSWFVKPYRKIIVKIFPNI
jgi:hypothetical protein